MQGMRLRMHIFAGCILVVLLTNQGCTTHATSHSGQKTWKMDIMVKLDHLSTDGISKSYYKQIKSTTFTEGAPKALIFGRGMADEGPDIVVSAGVRYVDVAEVQYTGCEAVADISTAGQDVFIDASKDFHQPVDLRNQTTYFIPVCLVLKTKRAGMVLSNPILYGGVILRFSNPNR